MAKMDDNFFFCSNAKFCTCRSLLIIKQNKKKIQKERNYLVCIIKNNKKFFFS